MIIDAWMQHPNAEWIGNPMFESLRRWKPGKWSEKAHSIQDTLAEMDRAGVTVGMLCAWHAPNGPMISNDEVAQYCRAYPDRFVGIASVDLFRPMDAVRGIEAPGQARWFQRVARSAVALGSAARRPPLLPIVCRVLRA